jgi:hypothetical protein
MGLDQYAYAAYERGERLRYWDNAFHNKKTNEFESPYPLPYELAYWRKHQELQDWMDNLWKEKGEPYPEKRNDPRWGSAFNGVELELEWNDIQRLEDDISNGILSGYSKEEDLKFCEDAKEQLFLYRKRVFYYPSW